MKYKEDIVVLKGFMESYNPYDEGLLKMEDELLKEFGRRLRQQRKMRGFTQEELGEKAGICYKYIGEIERGEKNPTLMVILKIAASLGIKPSDLLCIEACDNEQKSVEYIVPINKILMNKDSATLCKVLKVLQAVFER